MACETGTQKLFYWNIEKFFDMSSIETMYRSDTTDDSNGVSVLDRFSLTNNDKAFFDKLLKRGASEAYKVLQPMGRTLSPGFKYNDIPSYTVEELNDLDDPTDYNDILIKMEDAGTLTTGSLAVIIGTQVYFNGTAWVNGDALTTKYIFFNLMLAVEYDLNNIEPLDDMIFEFITLYVVKEWFHRHKFDLSLIIEEYDRTRQELKNLVNFRKTITRSSRSL